MQKNLKPPTTFEQQATILKQRGVIIEDNDICIDFLSKVNYYRLSGYLLPFRQSDDNYSVSLNTIKNIYEFDALLRNHISLTIESIEIFIRTQLAYFSAHHYGADGYMDRNNYNAKYNYPDFISRVNSCIQTNIKSPVIHHHIQVYNGKFPIWVIIDYFSLGMLSYFYTGMKNSDKKHIARNLYSVNYETLSSWLRCLTDLRNRCAHYSRLYYWVFTAIPKTSNNSKIRFDRTLFSQIYMLKLMYPSPDLWDMNFVKPLNDILNSYPGVELSHIGFPTNWYQLLSF